MRALLRNVTVRPFFPVLLRFTYRQSALALTERSMTGTQETQTKGDAVEAIAPLTFSLIGLIILTAKYSIEVLPPKSVDALLHNVLAGTNRLETPLGTLVRSGFGTRGDRAEMLQSDSLTCPLFEQEFGIFLKNMEPESCGVLIKRP